MSLLATKCGFAHSCCHYKEVTRFGQKMRFLRKKHGLTQAMLAERLGHAGHSYISEVEKGRKEPSLSLVLSVADEFSVTTDALLRDGVILEGEEDELIL